MILANKLNIRNQLALDKAEEKLSKQKAKALFDSGDINVIEVGTFAGLKAIHQYLFEDLYSFAGKCRDVNIAKGNFSFASVLYLQSSLASIDKMPQHDFEQIVEKYVEMNIAHPFREGNGRATRIWLDLIFKHEIQHVVDWNLVGKDDYFAAMQLSPLDDSALKTLLKPALTDNINDRDLFMQGIDISAFYEGYSAFKTADL